MHLIVTWISTKEGIHMLAVFKMLLFVSVSCEIEKTLAGFFCCCFWLLLFLLWLLFFSLICEKFCE